MRRGLLGGTFDPVHNGHLRLAYVALEALALEGVWFLPAGQPWMRRGAPLSAREARREMTALAIAAEPPLPSANQRARPPRRHLHGGHARRTRPRRVVAR